jgi:phage protein U
MAVGYFGDVIFSTSDKRILSFRDFKMDASSNWGEHKRNGLKSQWEFLGPGAGKVSFAIELDAAYGVNPRDELNKLIEYAEKGYVTTLMIGGRNVGSKWRLTNVSSVWDNIMNEGELVKASVTLTLDEYA